MHPHPLRLAMSYLIQYKVKLVAETKSLNILSRTLAQLVGDKEGYERPL
jgi:hypothetical protein